VKGKNAAQIKILTLRMTLKQFFFCFIAITSLCQCSKNEATAPSYLKINQIDLKTISNTQGSSSAKISDAWIYIDDQLQGAFELPCEIPVSHSGKVKVSIAAGIKNTGQSSIRERYPFYTWYDTVVNLSQNECFLTPTVSYYNTTQFLFNGDFESNNLYFLKESDSDTNLYKSNNSFEGLACGEMSVDSNRKKGKIKSALQYNIPTAGKRIFIELNYACDASVIAGLILNPGTSNNHIPIITLSSTKMQWNKIYIDLTNTLAQANSSGKFEFYFEIQQISGEDNKVQLDNIKLVSQ
jgi:hypothetical protein